MLRSLAATPSRTGAPVRRAAGRLWYTTLALLAASPAAGQVSHGAIQHAAERILDCFAAAEVEIMTPAFTALRDGCRAALPQIGSLPREVGLDAG